ncbi:MAG: ABC transporter substrate-binding protein, partial [Desulfobacterales bacterium]|nr:ABC transporter substrate-binding protein [Desulfobacterales bacterium]
LVEASQYPLYKRNAQMADNLIEVGETNTRLVCFNPNYPPLGDKRVRQAINLAVNTHLINAKFLKGKAYDPVGWLPVSSPAFDAGAVGYGYDLEKAKALMKAAGYEQGFELEFLGTGNKSYGIPVVETLVPFLEKLNIKVSMQQLEGGILYDRLVADDYQGIIWSFNSGPDPYQALRRWHSTNPNTSGNYVHYKNPAYDNLLDQALAIPDKAAQFELLMQADRLFQEDAPILFLNYNKAVVAKQAWVHGIQPVAIEMMYQRFEDVWVDSDSPRAK